MHLKSGRYYYVHNNKWKALSKDYREAMIEYAALMTDPLAGGMSELLDRWLADCKVKKTTLTTYKSAIESKIKPAFIEFHPSQVTAPIIAQFIDHHKHHPNTANIMRTILKMVFDRAVLFGLAQINPVLSVPRLKEAKRTRYLTDEEFAAIRAQANPTLQIVMDICYYTGQRIGDVLKIQMADINGDLLYVKQIKTGKEMNITITPELRKAIDTIKPGNIRGQFPLFGRRLSYARAREWFVKARDAAGIKDARLHDLRAKSITEAEKQGIDGQTLAGHTDRKMTERYIRDRELPVATPPKMQKKAAVS
jgi:integrase